MDKKTYEELQEMIKSKDIMIDLLLERVKELESMLGEYDKMTYDADENKWVECEVETL